MGFFVPMTDEELEDFYQQDQEYKRKKGNALRGHCPEKNYTAEGVYNKSIADSQKNTRQKSFFNQEKQMKEESVLNHIEKNKDDAIVIMSALKTVFAELIKHQERIHNLETKIEELIGENK